MGVEERPIVSASARLLLAALIVSLAEAEPGHASFDTEGAGKRLSDRLRDLSVGELLRLADAGALEVIVRLERDALAWSLHTAKHKREARARLEYLVRHGASRTLLVRLFGISRQRIDTLRRALQRSPKEGRPRLPQRTEREAIGARWTQLETTTPDPRERYRTLHGEFPRYSIAALDAVIREFALSTPRASGVGGKRAAGRPVSAPGTAQPPGSVSPRRPLVHRRDLK